MVSRLVFSLITIVLLNPNSIAPGDDAPAWLKSAASAGVPAADKTAGSVVLHDEARKTVDENGKTTTVTTYAVRILSPEGRRAATARAVYNTDAEKVKEMRAWLIRPSGEVKSYGKNQIIDAALVDNDIYNEARFKLISATDEANAGSVFGCEIVTEERSVFSQFVWYFQDREPVLLSRITVALPEGWKADGVTFNRSKIEPAVSGSTYTWELRNLPGIVKEPSGPEITNIAPRIAISIYPPEGKSTSLRTFSTWKDVSKYTSELSDPQASYNEAMAAKALELTAGAKTEFEKIQAIGQYAQKVNYISIQIGTGRGGGYRPHPAVDIFNKNYGDCKDKTNLMRAMLKSLGIDAYPVSIFSGDPTYVRSEWPSPHQFNHCIVAVKVGDQTEAPTIINHAGLGRLLIFDPTDEDTPVGDLPDYLQGSLALVVAGEAGDLVRMPATPPEANRLERSIEAMLNAEGLLEAKISERSFGQAAVAERRLFKQGSKSDYVKLVEQWIVQSAPAARVSKVEPLDETHKGLFSLDVDFLSHGYGKVTRGRLMVFKPAIVSRRTEQFLTSSDRKHPVVLEAEAYDETARIKLPEGFEVDEMPDPDEINLPFGNYAVRCEVKDGFLTYKRTLVLKNAVIPSEEYQTVRNLFERIRKAEQSPVVLLRK